MNADRQPLSARQDQILRLVSAGHSNKEIARLLGLTEGTVKQHAYALFRKLGVRNRAMAAVQALEVAQAQGSADRADRPDSDFAPLPEAVLRRAAADLRPPAQARVASRKTPPKTTPKTPPKTSPKAALASAIRSKKTAHESGAATLPARPWRRASDAPSYGLRLVTAVVVEPRTAAVRSGKEAQALGEQLMRFTDRAFELADCLDGAAQELPGGTIAVFFGQAGSHGDDPARALAYARVLASHGQALPKLRFGIGLATRPELVNQQDDTAVAASAYRRALQLAQHATPEQLLACAETTRLAGIRVEELPAVPVPGGAEAEGEWPPISLPVQRPVDPRAPARWAGLPAAREISASLFKKKTQWVAIESWPPEDATRLMETLGDVFEQQRVPVWRLWMPYTQEPAQVRRKLLAQWALVGTAAASAAEPSPTALESALAEVAQRAPAVVLLYGLNALPVLYATLPEAVFERLAAAGVAVVGTKVQQTGAAQTSLRLLGAHPQRAHFTVVHRLPPHRRRGPPAASMQPGTQAVVDRLLEPERRLLQALARTPQAKRRELAKAAQLTREQADAACARLEAAGLVTPQGETIAFRDEATEAAVKASVLPSGA